MVRLHLVQVEGAHQPGTRLGGVLAGTNDGDDLVDVDDGQQQPPDQVQPFPSLAKAVPGAADRHLEPVIQVDLQQLLQGEGPRLPLHERHRVDGEGVLQFRHPVELLQQGLGIDAVLDLHHQPCAVGQIGQVLHPGDADQLARIDALLDLFDDPFRTDQVGQFGDDDAAAARRDPFDAGPGPHLEGTTSGGVGVTDAVETDYPPPAGEVGAGQVPHQLLQGDLPVFQERLQRGDHLPEVVRGDVSGHSHRDPRGPVDQEVRQGRGQHLGFGVLAVVVRPEIDDVLVQTGGHRHRGICHPALGVTHRGWSCIE